MNILDHVWPQRWARIRELERHNKLLGGMVVSREAEARRISDINQRHLAKCEALRAENADLRASNDRMADALAAKRAREPKRGPGGRFVKG